MIFVLLARSLQADNRAAGAEKRFGEAPTAGSLGNQGQAQRTSRPPIDTERDTSTYKRVLLQRRRHRSTPNFVIGPVAAREDSERLERLCDVCSERKSSEESSRDKQRKHTSELSGSRRRRKGRLLYRTCAVQYRRARKYFNYRSKPVLLQQRIRTRNLAPAFCSLPSPAARRATWVLFSSSF